MLVSYSQWLRCNLYFSKFLHLFILSLSQISYNGSAIQTLNTTFKQQIETQIITCCMYGCIL